MHAASVCTDLSQEHRCMLLVLMQGLAKNIGVSNMSIKKLQDVLSYARIVPAVNQVEVHPYFRNQELIEFCAANGVHVTAYSSLGTPSSAGHLVKKSAPNPSHVSIKILTGLSEHFCKPSKVVAACVIC